MPGRTVGAIAWFAWLALVPAMRVIGAFDAAGRRDATGVPAT